MGRASSHRTVCSWVAFNAGQQQLKDAARPGRPATTTAKGTQKKIRNILKTDKTDKTDT